MTEGGHFLPQFLGFDQPDVIAGFTFGFGF